MSFPNQFYGNSIDAFPANSNPQDAHLHATLQRIDEIANDVDMQPPPAESATFLIVDTNILLHHFDVLIQFVDSVERLQLPVIVVIPGVVIYELDGQKNRDGLAWFARRASAWLLKKVKEKKSVKVQANEETCKPSGNWKSREDSESERRNDGLILDCCRYFRRGGRTFLCSADNNLCIECESDADTGIPTISPSRQWSSQEIALIIFGNQGIDLNNFTAYRVSYKDPRSNSITLAVPPAHDDSSMEVDDDETSMTEFLLPSHALDLLHIQVIEHFASLLFELVGRVGGPEIHKSGQGTAASRYAPEWQKRRYSAWTAKDCLEYLNSKKKVTSTNPQVGIFLSIPYSYPGARRGQDWSRRDWDVALGCLARIGTVWKEESIGESLGVLDRHVEDIFATKMRPTGI